VRADHGAAAELAEELLRLAQAQGDPALRLEAHRALGQSLCWRGQFAPAREHLEQAVALYNPEHHRAHAARYGRDPGLDSRCYAVWTLCFLGSPDQALEGIQEALPRAQALSHPFTLAVTLIIAGVIHQLRREVPAAQARADAVIALSTEHGFPYWRALATVIHGWALAVQGRGEEGIAQMQQGLADWRATGAEFIRPYYLALLAEGYARLGQTAEGLGALTEALALVQRTGERMYEAELHRLTGECLLAQEGTRQKAEEAEACLQQALAVARAQGAKSWELRAAVSLGRVWQRQGKRAEARELLAPIYGWFTEGFDTSDLQEARALLDALAEVT